MLFLVSIALVIGAVAFLLVGLATSTMSLVYVSIAASIGAGVVLFASVRLERGRQPALAGGVGPLPQPEHGAGWGGAGGTAVLPRAPGTAEEATPPDEVAPSRVPPHHDRRFPDDRRCEDQPPDDPSSGDPSSDDPSSDETVWAPAEEPPSVEDEAWDREREADAVLFPIADYDELTVDEVSPLLPQLFPEEIGVVEARERATRNRPEVLEALAELRSPPEPSGGPGGPVAGEPEWEVDEDDGLAEAPDLGGGPDVEDRSELGGVPALPIEDYDDLSMGQLLPVLDDLDPEELERVRAHEAATRNRATLVAAIDRRLAIHRRSRPRRG